MPSMIPLVVIILPTEIVTNLLLLYLLLLLIPLRPFLIPVSIIVLHVVILSLSAIGGTALALFLLLERLLVVVLVEVEAEE